MQKGARRLLLPTAALAECLSMASRRGASGAPGDRGWEGAARGGRGSPEPGADTGTRVGRARRGVERAMRSRTGRERTEREREREREREGEGEGGEEFAAAAC